MQDSKLLQIAVIEDDNDLRNIYVQLLERHDFPVIAYDNGLAALNGIRQAPTMPSLILLDYMLPGLNAHQFLDELTRDRSLEKIPVILVSALTQDTPEIVDTVDQHPWVIGYVSKVDVAEGGLIRLVQSFFGIDPS